MTMQLKIKTALESDAVRICKLLHRSITLLCAPDHMNDPDTLKSWLSNKTPDNIRNWIASPNNHVVVALNQCENDRPGKLLAIGAMENSGYLTLNYVDPDARFQSVSKAVLKHLEDHARSLRLTHMRLESTQTAHRFYLAAGYINEDKPAPGDGIYTSYMMVKSLG